jgi:hypothetical protein
MKKALIAPNEPVQLPGGKIGWRVAQVENDASKIPFEVAHPLFWVNCNDDVVADQFTYDAFTKAVTAIPVPTPPAPIGGSPNVIA